MLLILRCLLPLYRKHQPKRITVPFRTTTAHRILTANGTTHALEDIPEDVPDQGYSVEEQAIYNIKSNAFWNSLTDEDKQLLSYSMEGMTQREIADKIGYKTHTAVSKRLAKIRAKFYKV